MNLLYARFPQSASSRLGLCLSLLLILVSISMNSIAQDETIRHPTAGPIKGQADANGALSWRGIPYARSPVGALRWKAPRALKPFDEVFTASQFGDMCTQLGTPLLDIDPSLYGKAIGSEDCLTLNIWSPPDQTTADQDSRLLPVMVWVHGGSNVGGSSSLYYGGNLAVEQNVVVVTINYRVAEIEVDRDLAFVIGEVSFRGTPRNGSDKVSDEGRYVWILRREDSGWKIARYMRHRRA